MPVIQDRFYTLYPDFMVIAVEDGESLVELHDIVGEEGFTFILLAGSDPIARHYDIHAYPTSFFMDANGVIHSVVVESMSGSELDAELVKIGRGA